MTSNNLANELNRGSAEPPFQLLAVTLTLHVPRALSASENESVSDFMRSCFAQAGAATDEAQPGAVSASVAVLSVDQSASIRGNFSLPYDNLGRIEEITEAVSQKIKSLGVDPKKVETAIQFR